jgi:hypothetical protein
MCFRAWLPRKGGGGGGGRLDGMKISLSVTLESESGNQSRSFWKKISVENLVTPFILKTFICTCTYIHRHEQYKDSRCTCEFSQDLGREGNVLCLTLSIKSEQNLRPDGRDISQGFCAILWRRHVAFPSEKVIIKDASTLDHCNVLYL